MDDQNVLNSNGRLMNRSAGICLLLLGVLTITAAGRTVVEWTFDKPGDLQGWQPNEQLKNAVVTNGALACRAEGRDPILELQPRLEFKTSPRQMVEIRLKSDADGAAQLFWSNASTGLYGGFAEHKSLRFRLSGDGAWRVYRLLPCWHPEGKVVRLRFDLYDAARFELDYIRVVELSAPDSVVGADFDFARSARGWLWLETTTAREPVSWNGGKLHCDSSGLLLSPPLQLNADGLTLATVRLTVNRGTYGTLFFITEGQSGLHSVPFPIQADGDEHTYHLDLLENTNWRGRILALGLQPSDATDVTIKLRSIKVADATQTPPQLAVSFFDIEAALPRAGVPSKLLAVIRNSGGRTATNIVARLKVPAGVRLLGGDAEERQCNRIGLGEEVRFEWKVEALRPSDRKFHLALTALNAEGLTQATSVRFTARLAATNMHYVPEPKPVRGPFEVGAYYFPGWPTADRWQWIQRFPERRPALGWYREGEPEVADWQIKWAVEHGITFFAYDWYWTQGKRHLEHGLHDGFFKARYRHLLKFCLLWANHNPPGTSSHDDCIAVTRYWIENYFRRPEHLTFDGKPVVIIYQPERLTEDLGSANVKRALDGMREECRRAGLKGMYITTCVADSGIAKTAAGEGYDAVTAYTWPGSGMTGEGLFAPYETLVPAYRRKWENLLAESPIPLAPLLVCGGWDSRPWHGDHGLVRFGRTPELFKRHLQDAKQFIETPNPKFTLPKMVLVEAWNEWGEGSYIEPHQQFGFGYLDAIRDVLTDAPRPHADMTPADVHLGPYDVTPAPLAEPPWEFDADDEGWTASKQVSEFKATNGCLSALTVGSGSLLLSPPMQARADEIGALVVRMKLSLPNSDKSGFADTARCSWRTGQMALTESRNIEFPVQADGQWHEYRVPVSQDPRWRGTIAQLFLSPCRRPNVRVDLAFVRLKSTGGEQ